MTTTKMINMKKITLNLGAVALVLWGAVIHAAPMAYITNKTSATVSVVDTATNGIVVTIPVGLSPQGVAVDTAHARAYVANTDGNSVSAINTSTNSVVTTIPVGASPIGIAVNTAGTKVYVANNGDNTVSVIDTSTNTVVTTAALNDSPYGIAISPDDATVYVTTSSHDGVIVFDANGDGRDANYLETTGRGSGTDVVINGSGRLLYASINGSALVFDFERGGYAPISLPADSFGLALNAADTRLYVTHYNNNSVSVFNTVTNTVMTTLTVGANPMGVSINPAGTKVYVANSGSNTVSVIDTATNTISATLTVGSGPFALGRFIAADSASNSAPTVSLTTPANNAAFERLANITITATAADSDGTVAKVEFYQREAGTNYTPSLIGTVDTAPYTFTWTNVDTGNYSLTAVATDNRGARSAASAAIAVSVDTRKVYYIHADHLGTPRAITRPSDNAKVWEWKNDEPFGANAPNENPSGFGNFEYNLAFMGTYRDAETGTLYNVNRDLDPALGRYLQSDPIGLAAGPNTYLHVSANPLIYMDPFGLCQVAIWRGGYIAGWKGCDEPKPPVPRKPASDSKCNGCEDPRPITKYNPDIPDADLSKVVIPPTGGPRMCYNTCVARSIGKTIGIEAMFQICADIVEGTSARRSLKVGTKFLEKALLVKGIYGMVADDIPTCYENTCKVSYYGY